MSARATPAESGSDTGPGLAARVAADLVAHRSGDATAMAALVRRVTPLLWHVARGFRLDAASAEDVAQNALLAFVRHHQEIAEPQAALRWLVVTTRREAMRAAAQRDRTELVDEAARTVPAPEQDGPEPVALASATQQVLWRNVSRLPDRCRQLLRVIAFADRPDYATLSTALGMPIGSIGPTRGRCLAKLRALLASDPEWGTS
ncbi:MAG TPA: sigma-70 family RNA polymerase sigma factor [Pseudonocardiaceae bacterium]